MPLNGCRPALFHGEIPEETQLFVCIAFKYRHRKKIEIPIRKNIGKSLI